MSAKTGQRGISLIELVIFIVVVSVGVAGILQVMNMTARHSADPLAYKQAIAVAEALLEEIALQPFTYCDPTDPAVTTPPPAPNSSHCAFPEIFGPEGIAPNNQQRGSLINPLNNVNDYGGSASGAVNPLMPAGISDATGAPIPGLAGYDADVTITEEGIGGVPNADSLRIDVRLQGGGTDVTISGYRLRYAPAFR